jgi:cell wall-associated NlpC family hydrolase
MRPLVVSAALFCVALVPVRGSADTTITHVAGVEVIESQADATPNPHLRPAATRPAVHRDAAYGVPALEAQSGDAGLRGSDSLIHTALSLVGTPYVWGGADTSGFDCSGFTYYAFSRLGIRIPRTADAQFAAGRPIVGDPLPGDLVFFQTYDYGASHVGIYLGNGRFVNSIGANVHVASFASPYFRSRYLGARRFLPT